VISVDNAGLR